MSSQRAYRWFAIVAIVVSVSVTVAWSSELTFEERLEVATTLEALRLSHRGSTTDVDEARPALAARVHKQLAESVALETVWNTPLTEAMLDAELRRMIERSRMPNRLRGYFAALGDDARLIRETLARPALVHRLTRGFFRNDRVIHAETRRRLERVRDGLASGAIDPTAEHPLRVVVNEDEANALGTVRDNGEAFYTEARFADSAGRARLARYVVRKRTWEDWWRDTVPSLDPAAARTVSTRAPSLALTAFLAERSTDAAGTDASCTDGEWNNQSLDDVPDPRYFATAVWTGSEMIVWGGYNSTTPLASGGRYDPATDSWEALSNFRPPEPRYLHTAVWTGTHMIVWGGWTAPGSGTTDTGKLYDPVTDSWSAVSTTGAPSPRREHTAVWTGSEMIIWGGQDLVGTGGRYDPAKNSWTPTSTTFAPLGRSGHTAVWTGTEMIVWGGSDNFFPSTLQNTGGRYNPSTDSWSPTNTVGVPLPREDHTAVWTGSQMVVWGGQTGAGPTNTGGRYDPATNTWTQTLVPGAPFPRRFHIAAWSGTEMLVWGGEGAGGGLDSGGRYDPVANSWSIISFTGAPSGRYHHVGVWSGSHLIVWSGSATRFTNDGGRYDPVSDSWTPTSVGDGPSPRRGHTAVWTGSEMIVWGGSAGPDLDTGGRYDPALDSWSETTLAGAPDSRSMHTAVWTGDEMIVWGGQGLGTDTGGRYDPVSDGWTATSTVGAPSARRSHSAVWTGHEMIVWGGISSPTMFRSGGRYDPASDSWTDTSLIDAPLERNDHTAVWTGGEMIVWGGNGSTGTQDTGGRYDPATDTWVRTPSAGAPLARVEHTAVWTGSEMIVWGGTAPGNPVLDDGGRYDPASDAWSPVSKGAAAPSARRNHGAVWSGGEMLVWSGRVPGSPDSFPEDGGRYDPDTDSWAQITSVEAPSGRNDLSTVWTGEEMIVWGGANGTLVEVGSGGRYCACVALTFFRDNDGDGFGDDGDTTEACEAPIGFVPTGGDCNDGDGAIWSTPGEVLAVLFSDPDTFSWSEPVEPGGTSLLYDVVRSGDPTDFVTGATCVSSDGAATSAVDTDEPVSAGDVFHYLVRAENSCADGQGPLGEPTGGSPREARACP